jgi:hypothetical protein
MILIDAVGGGPPHGALLAELRGGQREKSAAILSLRHDQAPMLGPAPVPEGFLEASMRCATR